MGLALLVLYGVGITCVYGLWGLNGCCCMGWHRWICMVLVQLLLPGISDTGAAWHLHDWSCMILVLLVLYCIVMTGAAWHCHD